MVGAVTSTTTALLFYIASVRICHDGQASNISPNSAFYTSISFSRVYPSFPSVRAQPRMAGYHTLEFPCSFYMAEIQVGGPRAGPDPPDQSHQLFIEYNFKLLLSMQVSQVSTHFHFWSLPGVSLLTIGAPTYKPLRSWCVTTQSGYPTLRRVQSLLFNVI